MIVVKNVFLIDDEIEVREGIRRRINWAEEGFEYCGDASDGEVAIPMINQLQPDIVITDIRMPFMDGLEVSRILRSKMPWVKIIILSGYDEFEYAREALRMHVHEYCLKPLSSSDLLQILHRVAKQIDHEAAESKRLADLQNRAQQHLSLTREAFLHELCKGTFSTSEAIQQATELDIDLIAKCYFVMIVESETSDPNMIHRDDPPCLNYKRNAKETVYIFKGTTVSELKQQATHLKGQWLEKVEQHPESPITFGFGKVKGRIQDIARSFAEADEEKSYYGMIRKVSPSALKETENETSRFDRNQLIDFLKFGDVVHIHDFSQSYASHLKEMRLKTPFFLYYVLMDFTITVIHHVEEWETDPSVLLQKIGQLENKIRWIKNHEGVVHYMEEILYLVIETREQANNKFHSVIQKAKDHMHKHYHDSQLSLQTVANAVNVSPSYFSHIFSQETGHTFTEYLTLIRIGRAKELLKTTSDRTYEIAHKVGYSDPHYFCHLFKKATGMTTKEFKSRGQILTF